MSVATMAQVPAPQICTGGHSERLLSYCYALVRPWYQLCERSPSLETERTASIVREIAVFPSSGKRFLAR